MSDRARRIETLLVANRGEIARRIFRTARSMGIRCAAAFTDADADALHVRDADEAVRLPGGYLDGDALIEAAAVVGADAVHPGYGFLAENATFAAEVESAGMVWVGPSPAVIETMGDKLAAKRLAVEVGVPSLPSTEDPANDLDIGYPLLVKAAAGGGGRGMRVVERPEDLAEAVAAAEREAVGGFGDDRVFLERYLSRCRHVEIQILGDHHAGLVHLGERECSIQRRHQKIIEESPSPIVDGALRMEMGAAALTLASALGYESAGTVEFLVDDESGEFWFLEVNTRIQVEHPVTEEVTGIDLVREQLRIAAGEPLGYLQSDISLSGHAVEVRLYAEDPSAGFLPATGTLAAFEPAADPAVRWDSSVEAGSVVSAEFDPMLAKVVSHAPTRSEAIGRLALALERLHIGGVTTNRDFLAETLRSPAFLAGDTTTDFIERVDPPRMRELGDEELPRVLVAAAMWLQCANRHDASIWRSAPSGWRNARLPPERVELGIGDQRIVVHYRSHRDGSFAVGLDAVGLDAVGLDAVGLDAVGLDAVGLDAGEGVATVHRWTPDRVDVEWAGRRGVHRVTRAGDNLYATSGRGTAMMVVTPRFELPELDARTGAMVAPMPGVVIDVRVGPGDPVTAGQTLMVLEAMKMEHHIDAGVDGVVGEVHVEKGQQLERGALLLVIEPASRPDDGSSDPA